MRDIKKKSQDVSEAIGVPLVWMFLAGSRYIGQWLNLGPSIDIADPSAIYNEGSPIDRLTFFILIIAGTTVLGKRKIIWNRLIIQNKWICLYLAYCAVSILWCDYPFTSLKRWIKDLGNIIMAMVILTEKNPYEATTTVLRRIAFMLVPLSILLIRYYPELGRSYHMGNLMVTGVANQKNGLG